MNAPLRHPISYRCSSLPLLFLCPASGLKPELLVHETCDAARTGTDVHTHLQSVVETGRHGEISDPETRTLVSIGKRMWFDHLRDLFPSPRCENSLEVEVSPGITVTGHTDVQSGMIGTCRILDWKTGRVDRNYAPQLLGYAALAMLDNHAIEQVDTHIGWIRDYEIERHSMTRADLPDWVARIERIAGWSGGYESGEHCDHCPRSHECPGHAAIVRRDVGAILDLEDVEAGLATMTPERKIELYRQAKLVGAVAERVRSALRNHVDRCGDVIAGESRLTVSVERRRAVDAFNAWPVLQELLDDRELALCCKLSAADIDELVAKKAGKGQGAAAKRALRAKLEEADALHFGEVKKLVEKRT